MKKALFLSLCFSFSLFSEDRLTLDLEKSVEIAMKGNPFILEIRQIVAEAEAGKLESISKWFPKIEGTYQMFRDQKPDTFSGSRNNFLTQLKLTQSILSTQKYFGLKLAKLQLELMNLLFDAAVNDLLLDIRSFYYKLVEDNQNVQTAKEHVELLVKLAMQMQDRKNIGTAKQYEVNQSQVLVANATQRYYEALRMYKSDADKFTQLLGLNPGSVEIDVTDQDIPIMHIETIQEKVVKFDPLFTNQGHMQPIYYPGFPFNQEKKMRHLFSFEEIRSYEEVACLYNPMLQSKDMEVNIAQKKLSEEWGTYLPEVFVEGNFGGAPDPFIFYPKPTFKSQEMQWGIGLQVNWLLFDSLGRENRIRKAKSKKQAMEFAFKKEKQELLFQVNDQVNMMEEAIASYITSKGNVELAEQTLLQAQEQLEIGYIDIFDYQISVDGLIQAKNIYTKAGYDLIRSYYGLMHALGKEGKEIGKLYGRESTGN